jgi:hypothetical protein
VRADEQRRPHRHDRRQRLRSPVDRLFEERSIGISCEKPTPNAAENRRLRWRRRSAPLDDPAGTRRSDGDIPTQFRSFPLVRFGRSRNRLTISS